MMNQEDLFKKIGLILSELQDQYQFLSQNPQNLNELELELFLANANFLTDHVQIVKKVNTHKVVKEIPEHSSADEAEVVEPLVLPAKKEEEREKKEDEIFKLDQEPASFEFILSDHSGSDKFEFEEKEVGQIFDRPLSEEEERIIAQKQKLREQKEQEAARAEEVDEVGPEPFLVEPEEEKHVHIPEEPVHIPAEPIQTPIEPIYTPVEAVHIPVEPVHQRDLFVEEPIVEKPVIAEHPTVETSIPEEPVKPTLNELLGNSFGTNPRGENLRTEVTDLKQAINLNDKLLYIKDLFNGYNLAYAEVIDLVNKMPDFKTADHFLQNNYAAKNDWASKQETVDRFYELLNRRFPAK